MDIAEKKKKKTKDKKFCVNQKLLSSIKTIVLKFSARRSKLHFEHFQLWLSATFCCFFNSSFRTVKLQIPQKPILFDVPFLHKTKEYQTDFYGIQPTTYFLALQFFFSSFLCLSKNYIIRILQKKLKKFEIVSIKSLYLFIYR